jgi:polygalacturonase
MYLMKQIIVPVVSTIFLTHILFGILPCFAVDVTILDYGASVEAENNAAAIQKAIDDCAEQGGGTVHVPSGTFVTGSLVLRSHVTLNLHTQATLKGTTNHPADYPKRSFIFAEEIENAGIVGNGTIDGMGDHRNFQFGDGKGGRPHLVRFRRCRNMTVKEVTLKNSAAWTLNLFHCDGVTVRGIHLYSHGNHNNDGIDIDSKNVVISDCRIDCSDDAVCFKSSDPKFIVEHVVVSNCIIASNCNAIKFGTASFGGFRNIAVSNCVIRAASENNIHHWQEKLRVTAATTNISGIALEVVDGGTMDRIVISNISMQNIQTPIFIRLGSRTNQPGILKNVVISGVTATSESLMSSIISGIPEHFVENITLRDIILSSPGGGTKMDAERIVPENIKGYPENRMFGDSLPAYGLYVRHARNIVLDNVQCYSVTPDERPAFLFLDTENILRNNVPEKPAVP